MKNRILIFFAALGILLSGGCENEFTVIDDWKEIAVVYGLINVSDTAQYIRVEKAFLDPETSAITIAQIPDSIYFQNVSVTLKEIGPNGNQLNSFQLELVDGNLEGYPREDGIFASAPNFLYKTTQTLDEDNSYKLEVNTGDDSNIITAETPTIGEFDVLTPPVPTPLNAFRLWNNLQDARVTWDKDPDAVFFDVNVTVNVKETTSGATTFKSFIWPLAQALEGETNAVSVDEIPYETFLEFIAGNLEPVPNVCREIVDLDFAISAGGAELLKFIEVGDANIGVTGSIPTNFYTNLSDGFGIFSTRNGEVVEGVIISNDVVTELNLNPITADLGFRLPGDPPCN